MGLEKMGKPETKFLSIWWFGVCAKNSKYSKIILVLDVKLHRKLARKGENNLDTGKLYNWKILNV